MELERRKGEDGKAEEGGQIQPVIMEAFPYSSPPASVYLCSFQTPPESSANCTPT